MKIQSKLFSLKSSDQLLAIVYQEENAGNYVMLVAHWICTNAILDFFVKWNKKVQEIKYVNKEDLKAWKFNANEMVAA